MSSGVLIPLSLTAVTPFGMRAMSSSDTSRSTVERPEIAVVDADDGGAGVDRDRQLVAAVHFDERVETEVAGFADQSRELGRLTAPPTISSTASAPAARASSS